MCRRGGRLYVFICIGDEALWVGGWGEGQKYKVVPSEPAVTGKTGKRV